ncbi:WD40-repeat-containing domain protein [Infundibulicybe gibba]|nr:WD40-repeat-containing domain protein [Infundibulicybe gibba]
MDEISASGGMGSRKRMLSITTDDSIPGRAKRPRVSAISTDLQRQVLRRTPSISAHARPLSGSSSFTTGSRAGSPGSESSAFISRSGLALMRSLSSASIRSARGNRIHYKNITTSEEVGQLCKLQESHGDLKLIECGGVDQPEIVAVGTTKGLIHIWDIRAKRLTTSWSTRGVSAFAGTAGTIRHYDTRIAPSSKMKEQARKVTRHQARITSLSWNVDGNCLPVATTAVQSIAGTRARRFPSTLESLSSAERRCNIWGRSPSAVAWCPWQAKMLATGDAKGTVHLWNVNTSSPHSNALVPGKLELGSPITGLHFSPHCKEFLTTHGTDPNAMESTGPQSWPRSVFQFHRQTTEFFPVWSDTLIGVQLKYLLLWYLFYRLNATGYHLLCCVAVQNIDL